MIKEKIQTAHPDRLIEHLAESCKAYHIDRTDGLRITKGDAWALVRPSGTEPFVRIMVESAVTGLRQAVLPGIDGLYTSGHNIRVSFFRISL